MTLKNDAVYRKTDLWFQIWHEKFGAFPPNHSNVKNFHFDGTFSSKVYEVWAKKYRGVFFHDTKQWWKIGINPALMVSKMAWGLGWTFIRAPKSQIGLFYIVLSYYIPSISRVGSGHMVAWPGLILPPGEDLAGCRAWCRLRKVSSLLQDMGVSINGGTWKWLVYKGKSH